MVYSEKQPLLDSPIADSETSTIGCPNFSSLLSKPFQFLPLLTRTHLTDNESDDDYDDDDIPEMPASSLPPVLPQSELSPAEKLHRLRQHMRAHKVGVYIIPSEDEHQSEYTTVADRRREYISGFTGSAGIAVVTLDDGENLTGEAALATDGRYFLQAEKELDSDLWYLIKLGQPGYPNVKNYAIERAVNNKFSNVLAVDPKLISLSMAEFFERAQSTKSKGSYEFKSISEVNLVDGVWGADKPKRSLEPVYHLPLKYSGVHTNDKLEQIRTILKNDYNGTHLVVTALDEIAWLFNLRSDADIPFNPVFFAYAIVTLELVTLFIKSSKIDNGSEELHSYLKSIRGLQIREYEEFYTELKLLKLTVYESNTRIVLPSRASTTFAVFNSIPQSAAKRTLVFESIIADLKLTKNPTELLNAKIAQYKDSLAFILFFSWLEHTLIVKKRKITEYEAACKIYSIREKLPNFKGLSYETISSTGANASVIHYAPQKDSSSIIDPSKLFLIDSGSHYLEGTTDITRTCLFDTRKVTPRIKKLFTLVLKGHLAVSLAKFSPGFGDAGAILDSFARQPLWNQGLDFNHGTGHGVGSFGLVHEAPLYINSGDGKHDYFHKGAILTIEPGYYEDGSFGIRIESELEIIEHDDRFGKARNGSNYYGFNYLTKVPFSRSLIDTKYLSAVEVNWINEYHKSIREEFGEKILELGDKRAYKWLLKETTRL
ncbi:Creatinase/aminopeptidase [Suhomyces tanzawaensis NRRL Y-17324]|uniref:Creatinase/aminopeptidase n=1 Tax=Suhomyces tanzawaensis NRRL Y-17324 TaxID=984487 RepID=A0A1E4SK93_9ASCO|nr:Creatinase/aminopeptidase [Suhomyces tanzawaensis NRRL Y-17324]ODV79923.1 Creatinase/aminopeptidase [Suhomyces tanzawaensis NRRL Y-17324]